MAGPLDRLAMLLGLSRCRRTPMIEAVCKVFPSVKKTRQTRWKAIQTEIRTFEIKGNRRYSSQVLFVAGRVVYWVQGANGLRSSQELIDWEGPPRTTIERVGTNHGRQGAYWPRRRRKICRFSKQINQGRQAVKSLFERQVGRRRMVVWPRCV